MAPLISSNGHRVGTLCIMGQEPRKFDATRGAILANLSELLVSCMACRFPCGPLSRVLTPLKHLRFFFTGTATRPYLVTKHPFIPGGTCRHQDGFDVLAYVVFVAGASN